MPPAFIPGIPAGCPPPEAVPAAGDVYRIVKHDPPTAGDFLTPHEAGTLKRRDPCLRCGLSVLLTLQDAGTLRDNFPFLGDFIACGLVDGLGVTRATPGFVSSHTTWWPYSGLDRHSPFRVVQ
jgi:hypothetical protein